MQFQLNCVCAVISSSSPGTEQFMKHSTKDIVPGQSDVLLSLKNSFELLQASGLRSYRPAFSIVVVT